MIDMQPRAVPAGHDNGALYLQFHLGDQRFALSVQDVIKVLPRQPLKPVLQAPHWVAGILAHRGQLVPVVDLAALCVGRPALQRTSTRLVLVRYRSALQLGLILEHATETLRCRADEFKPYGVDNDPAPYLGPVRQDAQGMVQRIEVDQVLPEAVHRVLYPDAQGGTCA
ncbi:chemotaxis protein CheW [Pseudomonas putida]|uniref:chemotaxis protein CheW n=1 Tax=Pseudomonas putida TaxID=303 RepID=UPI0035712E0E